MGKKLSFVIPCYRSASTIGGVVQNIVQNFGDEAYEVILINDSSPDDTLTVIEQLCDENENVIGIDLAKNFGQHSAIIAGLHEASGECIVCLDDDGQTPPEEAKGLIDAVLVQGHDVAIARYQEKKHSFLRNMGSKLNEFMAQKLIGKPKELFLSSFVAFKPFIKEQICAYSFPFPYISGMLLRATNDIVNVDVVHRERKEGKSGYTLGKLFSLWLNGFTNFSIKPLRMATVLGTVIAAFGFVLGIYAIIVKITNPQAVLGWASMVTAIVFIGGIILIVLGLVGEYIGRMYMGLNQQPQYVVRKKIKKKDSR